MELRGPYIGYDKETDEVMLYVHGRKERVPSSCFPEFEGIDDIDAKESAVKQAARLALADTIRLQIEPSVDKYDFASAKAEFVNEDNLKKPFSRP